VGQIALSDRNTKLLVLGDELEIWDVETGKLIRECPSSLSFHYRSPIATFDCYPFAFLGGNNGKVSVIDCEEGVELFVVPGPFERVESLLLSQDKLRLVVNGKWVIHLFWEYHFSSEDSA